MTETVASTSSWVEVEFDTSPMDRFFDRVEGALADISGTPLGIGFENASGVLVEWIGDRYDAFSRGGGYWAPLKPETIRQKANSYGGSGAGGQTEILVRTGRLRDSFNRGAPNHYQLALPDGYVEGSVDPIANFHQSPGPGSRNPKRTEIPEDPSEIPSGVVSQMEQAIGAGFQELLDQCAAAI